ncbi:MAG: DUF2497 domain-containing protein [Pseudomonadota bacterium]|jgi:cell pole-organizing protein PopZ|nr:DUF2497 domain-containing protein [Alphaproteobacteria bacterium]
MSSTAKQDMSMDEILASIRSYVAEGQSLPKETTEDKEDLPNARVIQLTEEVIPIQTIDVQMSSSKVSPVLLTEKEIEVKQESFENPFNRLQSEIKASTPAPANLSVDDLLNQLATPLIKNWIDQNLKKIVETIVEKEIERIRRG